MLLRSFALPLGLILGISLGTSVGHAQKQEIFTAETINAAQMSEVKGQELNAGVLKAQVLLDREGFSPGVIDARGGENFSKAVLAYQKARDLTATGKLDEATWQRLTENARDAVVASYAITAADLTGPFVKEIPKDYAKMAELKHLGYRGPREALSEKFHMDEDLLAALNPAVSFDTEGASILVASVGPKPGDQPRKLAKIVIDKTEGSLEALAADGTLIAYFPASVGSTEKPAPTGNFQVRNVAQNPTYRYNPDFKFKGQKSKQPIEIAPGPNGPVGAVWIGLSAKTYGIHGTSSPDLVSKTASHGCIRLTNWDALALAKLVTKGTPVEMR